MAAHMNEAHTKVLESMANSAAGTPTHAHLVTQIGRIARVAPALQGAVPGLCVSITGDSQVVLPTSLARLRVHVLCR